MKADIILLVDSSESICPVDFQKMKDFMQLIVNRSDIGADKVQIGLLQFSSEPQEEFQLNRYGSKADLRRAILGIRQIKSGMMTGKALTFASSYFDEPKGGRPRVKQYLIVIKDGEAQDILREPAETIRNRGITIYAIGVLHANNSQLVDIAGSQDKVFFEDNFDSLTFLEKEILFEICNPGDSCKRTEVADIIFVVHGSRSITDLQFQGIQRIMEAVVNDSVVGKDNVQFGAVVYSTNPQDRFSLNTYSAKSQVREAISNLTTMLWLTFTARALNFARDRFGMAYGGRTSSLSFTQILVLITDQPTSPSDRPNLPAAPKSLKQDDINDFAVGVDEASRTELEEIVGERERLFFVQSYNELESLHENLTHTVCDEAKPDCNIDVSVGIDISRRMKSISALNEKQKLQKYLPKLLHRMESLTKISCTVESQINTRFKYQVFTQNGQSLFDSDFEAYDEEILQKFLVVQTIVDTYLNADFLQSFWEKSLRLASAKVKINKTE